MAAIEVTRPSKDAAYQSLKRRQDQDLRQLRTMHKSESDTSARRQIAERLGLHDTWRAKGRDPPARYESFAVAYMEQARTEFVAGRQLRHELLEQRQLHDSRAQFEDGNRCKMSHVPKPVGTAIGTLAASRSIVEPSSREITTIAASAPKPVWSEAQMRSGGTPRQTALHRLDPHLRPQSSGCNPTPRPRSSEFDKSVAAAIEFFSKEGDAACALIAADYAAKIAGAAPADAQRLRDQMRTDQQNARQEADRKIKAMLEKHRTDRHAEDVERRTLCDYPKRRREDTPSPR